MRWPFKEDPSEPSGIPRPFVPVRLAGLSETAFLSLVDSGSLGNRFGRWVADTVGLDLGGAEESRLGLGGFHTTALTVPVELRLGEAVWHAPVSFCDPWPIGFQILGQEGFFRFFRVTFDASSYWLDCAPHGESPGVRA
ncbi:MAG: hypothetical protein ACRDZO_06065 [Egibacteraceae bacterium]